MSSVAVVLAAAVCVGQAACAIARNRGEIAEVQTGGGVEKGEANAHDGFPLDVAIAEFPECGIWYQDTAGRALDNEVIINASWVDGRLVVRLSTNHKMRGGIDMDLYVDGGNGGPIRCYAAAVALGHDLKYEVKEIKGQMIMSHDHLQSPELIRGLFMCTARVDKKWVVLAGGFTVRV